MCNQKLLRLIPQFPVFGIGGFLIGQQSGILFIQILYLRDLLHAQVVKGQFGSLMKRDLFPVSLKELLAVSGLSLFFIGASGLGIVDDVLLECGDLRKSGFGSLNGDKQLIPGFRLFFH